MTVVNPVAAATERKIEKEIRDEVCALLATLSTSDSTHYQQMNDAELIAQIRALPQPFQHTGDNLERVRKLLGFLQYATEQIVPKTRTEFEYQRMFLAMYRFSEERFYFCCLGVVVGVVGMMALRLIVR